MPESQLRKGYEIVMQEIDTSKKILSPEQQAILDAERANLEIAKIRNQISKLNIETAESNLYASIINEMRMDIERSAFGIDSELYTSFIYPRLFSKNEEEKSFEVDLDITEQQQTEPEQPEIPQEPYQTQGNHQQGNS